MEGKGKTFLARRREVCFNTAWICGRGGIGRLDGFRWCHLSEGFAVPFVARSPKTKYAPVMELVDMRDLGSRAFSVWVRVPSGAPNERSPYFEHLIEIRISSIIREQIFFSICNAFVYKRPFIRADT